MIKFFYIRSHIQPICLPSASLDLVGKKGVIAGWGKTKANMGHTGTNILQSASVPIISTDDCINWHDSKQIIVELFDEMFCAGHSDGHQDACLGNFFFFYMKRKCVTTERRVGI